MSLDGLLDELTLEAGVLKQEIIERLKEIKGKKQSCSDISARCKVVLEHAYSEMGLKLRVLKGYLEDTKETAPLGEPIRIDENSEGEL